MPPALPIRLASSSPGLIRVFDIELVWARVCVPRRRSLRARPAYDSVCIECIGVPEAETGLDDRSLRAILKRGANDLLHRRGWERITLRSADSADRGRDIRSESSKESCS